MRAVSSFDQAVSAFYENFRSYVYTFSHIIFICYDFIYEHIFIFAHVLHLTS